MIPLRISRVERHLEHSATLKHNMITLFSGDILFSIGDKKDGSQTVSR
jgi:hypothetical protein